jgi:hypothetical protein
VSQVAVGSARRRSQVATSSGSPRRPRGMRLASSYDNGLPWTPWDASAGQATQMRWPARRFHCFGTKRPWVGPVHREEHLDALALPSQPRRCPRRHTPDRFTECSLCPSESVTFRSASVGVGAVASANRARASLIQYRARSRSSSALPGQSRLYFRLIRIRSRASAGYHEAVPAHVTDGADRRRTLHRSPENRKVGGSTPPLATKSLVERI